MKALELRTFPSNQWGGYEIPLSVWSTVPNDDPDDFYVVQISADDARAHSERKRLTEPELAAEFEAARCDYLLSQQSGHFWAPLGETWPSDHESAGRRTSTLLRFATLPHYDEEN